MLPPAYCRCRTPRTKHATTAALHWANVLSAYLVTCTDGKTRLCHLWCLVVKTGDSREFAVLFIETLAGQVVTLGQALPVHTNRPCPASIGGCNQPSGVGAAALGEGRDRDRAPFVPLPLLNATARLFYAAVRAILFGCRRCQGPCAWSTCRNDTLFIANLITLLEGDSARIHVFGESNCGMMAHRVAQELPGRLASFAPVFGRC